MIGDSLPFREALDSEHGVQGLTNKTFNVSWRMAAGLSSRTWTQDVSNDGGIIIVQLHVCLPAIYFDGINDCSDMDKVLTAVYCNNVLQ